VLEKLTREASCRSVYLDGDSGAMAPKPSAQNFETFLCIITLLFTFACLVSYWRTRHATLNLTRSQAGSQWSLRNSGEIWSLRRMPVVSHAVAFSTDCSSTWMTFDMESDFWVEAFHSVSWYIPCVPKRGWLSSRVVSMLDSGAEGPGFKYQPRRCRVTVLGKLFTPNVLLFTKQQKW